LVLKLVIVMVKHNVNIDAFFYVDCSSET